MAISGARVLGRLAPCGMRRLTSSGNITLPSTVFHGSSWSNSWNTIMRSEPGRSIGLPASRIVPLDRLHEAGDRLEQRRLAAAGGPEQHEALALVDLEADAPGRGDEMLLGLVLQRHVVDREQRRAA